LTNRSDSRQAQAGTVDNGNGFYEPADDPAPDNLEQPSNEAGDPRLVEAERKLHEARARVANLSHQLQEANEALVDANQELAQAPLLKHRLAEMYDQNAALKGQLNDLVGSRSWQITGFLRRISHALKLQR
jgi:hypothetical protein